jgi:hypothetical protein
MRTYIKYISIGLAGILLLAFIVGFFLPNQLELERSIAVHAPASAVFDQVNNLKTWQSWSPWKDIDPQVTFHYEGPDAGVGSKMAWASNNSKIGTGSQEIVTSNLNQHISTRLAFKGWDEISTANWYFEEKPDGNTQVRWTYHSHIGNNIIHKYISILMIKSALGKDYEQGLKQLKAYVENSQQMQ